MNVSFTIIPNNFIDEYMVKANGEFVKIYLYVQSQIQANREQNLSLSVIADKFECTEKDVQRAFAYWEREGLLSLETDESTQDTKTKKANLDLKTEPEIEPRKETRFDIKKEIREGKTEPSAQPKAMRETKRAALPIASASKLSHVSSAKFTPSASSKKQQEPSYMTYFDNYAATRGVPKKAELPPVLLENQIKDAGLSQLVYMADTYFGKPLSATDLNTIFYFHDQLHFSVELIEFLIEYCVTNDKRNMRYIETVALSWYQKHITTVEEAKQQIQAHNKNYYAVMRALGIKNRSPIPSEEEMIKKWIQTYNFELPILLEACKRTIQKIHQPSFAYADKILSSWYTSKVKTLDDIKTLDEEHQLANPIYMKKGADSQKPENRFHNFDQRSYDFDALERQFDQQLFFQINHKNN